MKAVLLILHNSFQNIWADLWTTLACNLTWLIANMLVVTGPPATLALVHCPNRLAHDDVADLGDFWNAFKRYWGHAWRWGSINLAVTFFLVMDVILTGQLSRGMWSPYLQGLYLVLLAGWLILQFFSLPFLFEQRTMSLRQTRRKGMVLMLSKPGFALLMVLALGLVLIVGTNAFMLTLMFGAVFIGCAANCVVWNRLEGIKLLDQGKGGFVEILGPHLYT